MIVFAWYETYEAWYGTIDITRSWRGTLCIQMVWWCNVVQVKVLLAFIESGSWNIRWYLRELSLFHLKALALSKSSTDSMTLYMHLVSVHTCHKVLGGVHWGKAVCHWAGWTGVLMETANWHFPLSCVLMTFISCDKNLYKNICHYCML